MALARYVQGDYALSVIITQNNSKENYKTNSICEYVRLKLAINSNIKLNSPLTYLSSENKKMKMMKYC